MAVVTRTISFQTKGRDDMIDITSGVQDMLYASGLKDGIVTVFVPGSTASITTIEYEPGLLRDFPRAMEKLAPREAHYDHDARWGDGNGHSHVRASTIGPGLVVPFQNGRLMLGTWQQIVFVDFDNRPRARNVIVQAMGE
ncbi:MAG TPA: secondary thiamine-phosphate synthase enzyme YjbQ [Methanocella sp.]|uniref:secondary thiamine-phosphate synthase enzyme YjbQ n=1 Tax=Methanocella sp. TaxID=2052833 RepID=UPI002BD77C64|nr:secondary thiamine-phosphate synthase enzyme YjbQ [Methanocella sp.]HTY91203.1 secondary thiamine-phosphate synthase enzyme YjbQ [Methanocella sp.]